MGALWEIVALTRHRAVDFPDTCRIKDADIKGAALSGEYIASASRQRWRSARLSSSLGKSIL